MELIFAGGAWLRRTPKTKFALFPTDSLLFFTTTKCKLDIEHRCKSWSLLIVKKKARFFNPNRKHDGRSCLCKAFLLLPFVLWLQKENPLFQWNVFVGSKVRFQWGLCCNLELRAAAISS